MHRDRVQQAADYLLGKLTPFVDTITIAGDLRRKVANIGSLSIVMVPARGSVEVEFGMKAKALPPTRLHQEIERLRRQHILVLDTTNKDDGPKFKRLLFPDYAHLRVNLLMPERDAYGDTLILWTGDAKFAKAMFVPATKGGLLPEGWTHAKGRLIQPDGQLVACQTERDYFQAIGLPQIKPEARNEHNVRRLREQYRADIRVEEDANARIDFETTGGKSGKRAAGV